MRRMQKLVFVPESHICRALVRSSVLEPSTFFVRSTNRADGSGASDDHS